MGETAPVRAPSSAWPRIALAALVIAIAGAGAYIIHLHGRLAQLEQHGAAPTVAAAKGQPAALPADAPPPAPAAAPAISEAAIVAVLTPAQQQAMQDALRTDTSPNHKAWFQVQENNAETGAVQAALQRVFERAGWATETVRAPYPVKSGIFLLAGDAQPPPFVDTVNDAFSAAGIDVQYLTDYRSFFTDRKQQNPNWRGPELATDQAFALVIGSKPTPKPAGNESSSSMER